MIRFVIVLACVVCSVEGVSQRQYRGIVADSVSLQNLPDVHVTIKNSTRGVITNSRGFFAIQARVTDTLIFTLTGYKHHILPLLFEEDAIMILMRENVEMLANITVRATRLYPNKIENYSREEPRYLPPIGAIASPFDYFWRGERDKRRLARYVRENNRTQTFRQVISDPDVKAIMLDAYGIDDDKYYELIVSFNMSNPSVQYLTNPDTIMERLHEFFAAALFAR